MRPADLKPVLTVGDVMLRYGVTEGTVLAWIHGGELAAINVGRSRGAGKPRWRITAAAVAAFEAARTEAPTPRGGGVKPRSRKRPDVIQFYRE